MGQEGPTQGGGEEKPAEQLERQVGVNSYGTDDPEEQARIESARAAASTQRKRDRAEWERYVAAGINEEDAQGAVEFRHYLRDRRRQEQRERERDDVAAWAKSDTHQRRAEKLRRTSPRIYAACLASYNQGIRHGLWIEADQDAEELQADIDAMLAASPTVGAEEYAIHDSEGFFGFELGEHEDLAVVSRVARGIAQHGEAFAAYLSFAGSSPEALAKFDECWIGTFASREDWAKESGDNLAWREQLEERLGPSLRRYVRIDWELYARDMAEEWRVVEGVEGVHVFGP